MEGWKDGYVSVLVYRAESIIVNIGYIMYITIVLLVYGWTSESSYFLKCNINLVIILFSDERKE